MIAKSLIAAAAVATTMAVALPATQAEAKTNIDINVGLGFGGGGYGPGYYDDVYYPSYGYISCHKGAKIVKWSGFHKVKPVDCSLPGYKYTAKKNGHKYLIRVNGHGSITGVKKIF